MFSKNATGVGAIMFAAVCFTISYVCLWIAAISGCIWCLINAPRLFWEGKIVRGGLAICGAILAGNIFVWNLTLVLTDKDVEPTSLSISQLLAIFLVVMALSLLSAIGRGLSRLGKPQQGEVEICPPMNSSFVGPMPEPTTLTVTFTLGKPEASPTHSWERLR